MSKKLRLDKILSNMGYGTRKEIKDYIKKGNVILNDKIIKNSSIKVDPYNDEILFQGKEVEYKEYIYLMMNKPKEVVSSTNDPVSRTVIDLLEDKYKLYNPFPVGRLDRDTEGLLIITNDGDLCHQLLSPKKHVNKTYYVEVDGFIDEKYIDIFNKGIVLDDGYKTMDSNLEILVSDSVSKVKLTIREGKFHQVKRMFKAINMKVVYLKRICMGNIFLDKSIKKGDYRELTDKELKILKEE